MLVGTRMPTPSCKDEGWLAQGGVEPEQSALFEVGCQQRGLCSEGNLRLVLERKGYRDTSIFQSG